MVAGVERIRASERPECSSETLPRLSREQMIDRIMTLNPSAGPEFLEEFEDRLLEGYLEHLVASAEPRGRGAVWLRRGDSPAIVWRSARL